MADIFPVPEAEDRSSRPPSPPPWRSRSTPEAEDVIDCEETDKDEDSDLDLALADGDADDEGEGEKLYDGVFLIEEVKIPRPPLHPPPLSCYKGKGMGKDLHDGISCGGDSSKGKGKSKYRVTAYYARSRKIRNKWGTNNLGGGRGSGGGASSSINVQGE